MLIHEMKKKFFLYKSLTTNYDINDWNFLDLNRLENGAKIIFFSSFVSLVVFSQFYYPCPSNSFWEFLKILLDQVLIKKI